MAQPPHFRKPFRSGGGDDRGPEGFRPRSNFEDRDARRRQEGGADRPRFEGRDDRPQRPYSPPGQGFGGGYQGRQEFRGGDRRDFQQGGGGGFRPRFEQGGRDDSRGGGYGAPRRDWGDRPAYGGGGGGQGDFRPRFNRDDNRQWGDRPQRPAYGEDMSRKRAWDGPPPHAPRPERRPDDLLSAMDADGRPPRDDRGPRPSKPFHKPTGGLGALRDDEMKLIGRNACRALFEKAPRRLIRVYIASELLATWDDVLKFCRENKLAYHVAEAEELSRVSDSDHHEGICMIAVKKPIITVREFIETQPSQAPCCVVALDRVGNPHNIGAITRVAAHFGATAMLSTDANAFQSGAAARTAEGAVEHVELISCDDLQSSLNLFKVGGFKVIGTSSHTGAELFAQPLPARCVLLLGSEGDGLSEKLQKSADILVRIPGSGRVESLNVACAASVLLGEYWRSNTK